MPGCIQIYNVTKKIISAQKVNWKVTLPFLLLCSASFVSGVSAQPSTVVPEAGNEAPGYPETTILEEVVVTAQKRGNENLQDVAMSAAVISSELIDIKQLVGMGDYLQTIPSVALQDTGPGRSTMNIRGITADPFLSPATVGVYVNETPVTGLGFFATSSPDLKLIDVNRIEVLRGPQGTLYGAGSLGGTLRIITNSPELDAFSGSVEGSLSSTAGFGGANYDVQGVANIPLVEDIFAIRVVAYHFDYSGYYRNIAASDPEKSASAAAFGAVAKDWNNAGNATYSGGRVSALWEPTEKLSFNLVYLNQRIHQDGRAIGDLRLGEFEHARYTRYTTGRPERLEDDLGMVNLVIEYNFDSVGLFASTSWTRYDQLDDQDFGQYSEPILGADVPNFLVDDTRSNQFAQEVRAVSQWDKPVQFLFGLYYEDLDQTSIEYLDWEGDPAYDLFGGELWLYTSQALKTKQKAIFGEVSWALNEYLTLTGGMRYFDYKRSLDFVGDGIILGGPASSYSTADEDGNNYKVNVSYRPEEDTLYYAQWSQGFRLGFPTGATPDICDIDGDGLIDGIGLPAQEQLNSDTLDSYELGGKWSLADNRLDLRASVFRNDWKDIPLALFGDCGFSFSFNAGEARTSGVEFEGSSQLADRWRLDFSAGYLKGELTRDAPGLGSDGDRLPGSPKYSATLGLQYDLYFRSREAFLRADLAYVGGYYNNLQQSGQEIGNYTTLNLAGGLRLGSFDLQLFVLNATDSDAATWIDQRPEFPSAYRLRPRTVGLKLRYAFPEID